LFWGTRYVTDRYGDDDVSGWSNVIGADFIFDLNDKIDIGASGTVRHSLGGKAISYAFGPRVGIRAFENGWLSLGYNVSGFSDRDFDDARYSRNGPYMTLRFKLDSSILNTLGLGSRP
jgi:hypothetical protein